MVLVFARQIIPKHHRSDGENSIAFGLNVFKWTMRTVAENYMLQKRPIRGDLWGCG